MAEFVVVALMLLPLVSPLLLGAAVLVVAHTVVVTVRGRRPAARALWARLVVTAVCVGAAAYAIGLWSGGFFWISQPDDLCMISGYGYSDTHPPSSMWPLHNVLCRDASGPVDLVPAFVNPAVVVAIGLSLAGLTGSIVSLRADRDRKDTAGLGPGTAE